MVGMIEASTTRRRPMPAHAQLGIDHRVRVVRAAHGAGAGGWKMVVPMSPAAFASSSSLCFWSAGLVFLGPVGGHRRLGDDVARQAQARAATWRSLSVDR
jgi:hypothetical protein